MSRCFGSIFLYLTILAFLISCCDSFAGGGFGGGGTKGNTRKGGKTKAAKNKKKKNKSTNKGQGPITKSIQLGPDKSVSITVPPDLISPNQRNVDRVVNKGELLDAYASYRGRGDVIWPSSLHLSRLVANCPSFIEQRVVLDLGCGLGLASLATLLGKPKRLLLADIDEDVLSTAMTSCQNHLIANYNDYEGSGFKLEEERLDWSDSMTWPVDWQGKIDTILSSDVLYDESSAKEVASLIGYLLLPADGSPIVNEVDEDGEEMQKRALIVDPENRLHRDMFVASCAREGLVAECTPFPGQKDFVLINVTPMPAV